MLSRFKAKLNGQASNDDGQVLLIFLMAMTFVFVIGVLVVDVGMIISERRHAQTAADLAALAAAAKLDDSDAETIARGKEFAARNGYNDADPGVEVGVTPGYNDDPELVEVTVSGNSPALFRSIFDVAGIDVGARAVASAVTGPSTPGLPALFALSTDCAGTTLEIAGSDNTIVGLVHSNGGIKVGGSDNDFDGGFTYRCTPADISGSNNTFDPAHEQEPDVQPSPITPPYTFSSFPCDVTFNNDVDVQSVNSLWVNNTPNSKMLKTQVICGLGDIQLSGDGVSGNVTLVAQDELKISGSGFNLTGLWNDVLLFSSRTGDSAIDISGSGGDFIGIIYAPNGQAKVGGSDNQSVYGSVIASRIYVAASDSSINAFFDPEGDPGPPDIRLVD